MKVLLSLIVFFAASAYAQELTHALEISVPATLATFQCFKKNSSSVFIRVYKPDGQGSYDTDAAKNINYAFLSSLGIHPFMVPQPMSKKTALMQVKELMDGLKRDGINTRHMWIHVTNTSSWSTNQTANTIFVKALINGIMKDYNIAAGIFTDHHDWNIITGMVDVTTTTEVHLWFHHTRGDGVKGETTQDFHDFTPFAGWKLARVKRFAQNENVCGVMVNKIWNVNQWTSTVPDLPNMNIKSDGVVV